MDAITNSGRNDQNFQSTAAVGTGTANDSVSLPLPLPPLPSNNAQLDLVPPSRPPKSRYGDFDSILPLRPSRVPTTDNNNNNKYIDIHGESAAITAAAAAAAAVVAAGRQSDLESNATATSIVGLHSSSGVEGLAAQAPRELSEQNSAPKVSMHGKEQQQQSPKVDELATTMNTSEPPDNSAAPAATTDTTDANVATTLRRLLWADTIANILLFNGGCFFIIFVTCEIITACQRDVVADVLYLIAAGSFLVSGGIQYGIDMFWTRTIPIGRYTTNRCYNLIITILFICGIVADIVAFAFWRQGPIGVGKERKTQMVGNHLWFVAAIIVIVTNHVKYPCRRQRRQSSATSWQDRLDLYGNLCFLLESTMNLCARYVSDINPPKNDTLDLKELGFELAASVFWALNAAFYLGGDILRLKKVKSQKEIGAKQESNGKKIVLCYS